MTSDLISSSQKSLKLSLIDAFLYSLMVGAGETYLPAYALSIGLSEVFAGILATLPLVSGAFLQLFAPQVLKKVGSAKKWVVASAVLQALSFTPLVYFADHEAPGFWTLFLILTLYWGAGFSISPAWNYWMGHLVHESESKKFFSRRSRISQLGLMLGLIGGGVALHNRVDFGPFSSVFASLFFFAFICRLFSSIVLSRKVFKPDWLRETGVTTFSQTWRMFFSSAEKRKFFFRLFPFILSVYISSPFITPYMLGQLKMSYGDFMVAVVSLLVGKILASLWVERNQNPATSFQIFSWGALAVAPAPFFWMLSDKFVYILLLQLTSGIAWGFYEVGLVLIFFNNLKKEEKVSSLTIYNLLNSVGIILGTLIGASLLSTLKLGPVNYLILFALGAIFRIGTAVYLIRSKSQMVSPSAPIQASQTRAS